MAVALDISSPDQRSSQSICSRVNRRLKGGQSGMSFRGWLAHRNRIGYCVQVHWELPTYDYCNDPSRRGIGGHDRRRG
jgi:hypothetical protein